MAIEGHSKLKIQDVLQFQQGFKKVYFVENQKFITQVYMNKMNEELLAVMKTMINKFESYQSRFKNKTLRLCFSSQLEIYSIFYKIFGTEIFAS